MRMIDINDSKNSIEKWDLSREHYIEWVEEEVQKIRKEEHDKLQEQRAIAAQQEELKEEEREEIEFIKLRSPKEILKEVIRNHSDMTFFSCCGLDQVGGVKNPRQSLRDIRQS